MSRDVNSNVCILLKKAPKRTIFIRNQDHADRGVVFIDAYENTIQIKFGERFFQINFNNF